MERAARWASEVKIWVAPVQIVLVDSDRPRCQRPGCDNVLTGRQLKWCRPEHGGAVRQQNFRDRDLIQLSATDIDLIAQTLEAPKEFRRAVNRAWRNGSRPIDLGSGVTVDPEVFGVFEEARRRP
jgi:hypothetical protein